jgi:von Willebrand factor type A domain
MELVFVNPIAALAALAGLVPVAAWWWLDRRGRRVRSALGLPPPRRASRLLLVAAIVALALLVGAASAQPVLLESQPLKVRTDAEAYFVIDITRSMLASAGRDEPTRLERARGAARRLRAAVPDVPVGIASFTNRIVPHIFPTPNAAVFDSGLVRSIEIDRPVPDTGTGALLTAFDALAPLQTHNFFSPDATRRVAVVFTDGESQPVSTATIRALRAQPRLDLLLVRFWSEGERIHRPRLAIDRRYRTEPQSTALLE